MEFNSLILTGDIVRTPWIIGDVILWSFKCDEDEFDIRSEIKDQSILEIVKKGHRVKVLGHLKRSNLTGLFIEVESIELLPKD